MKKKPEIRVNPPEINVTSQDERFMEKLKAEIEKILSDVIPEFSIDAICDKLKISRAKLFKKVKAVTGVTPNEYIMAYRLERAAQLLIKDYGNVTQVGLAVGFENPNYFAKCFKEKFGKTPKAYQLFHIKNSSVPMKPYENDVPYNDEKFFLEFNAEIEKIFSHQYPEFNINALCTKMKIGRAKLFRKVKEITGKTPNEYIMSYRLDRAYKLLSQNYGKVTEVAMATGFESSQHFAKCFKEKFGQTPKAFQTSHSRGTPAHHVKINIEFTLEDLDRELIFRLPLPNQERLFKNKAGTPQRSEVYESIKNFYNFVSPTDSNKTLKHLKPMELIQKMRKVIDDLKEDAFKKSRYPFPPLDIYEIQEE